MKADTWMPLYVGDYLRDTMHLSHTQHGMYLLLLMHYWARGEALPDDDAYLAGVAKCMANEWQSHRQTLGKFFDIRDGLWRHKRVEAELQKAKKLREARSKAGKLGANGKWNGKTMAQPLAEPSALPQQSHTPSPSPILNGGDGAPPELPVELPPGFPQTLPDAKAQAAVVGCPEDFTEKTWNKAVSRGGRDSRDVPIRHWRSYLAAEWNYEQDRLHREKHRNAIRPSTGKPSPNRSAGTANEGKANDYAGLG